MEHLGLFWPVYVENFDKCLLCIAGTCTESPNFSLKKDTKQTSLTVENVSPDCSPSANFWTLLTGAMHLEITPMVLSIEVLKCKSYECSVYILVYAPGPTPRLLVSNSIDTCVAFGYKLVRTHFLIRLPGRCCTFTTRKPYVYYIKGLPSTGIAIGVSTPYVLFEGHKQFLKLKRTFDCGCTLSQRDITLLHTSKCVSHSHTLAH